jgi:putative sigma-54 modulation protein
MQVAVSFRHLENSVALKGYVADKLEHTVNKYIQAPTEAQVILSVEKFWHIAKLNLKVHGLIIKSEEKSEDMYSSIDLALDKLERQLRRYKDKIHTRKPLQGVKDLTFEFQVISPSVSGAPELDEEEMEAAARGEYDVEETLPEPEEYGYIDVEIDNRAKRGHQHVKVLRNDVGNAPAMTIGEAIMQLDLLNEEDVLVFTSAETGTINVLHRRNDGNYNLIETTPST